MLLNDTAVVRGRVLTEKRREINAAPFKADGTGRFYTRRNGYVIPIPVALHRALVCHVVKEQRHSPGKGGPAGCNEIQKAKKTMYPWSGSRVYKFPPNFLHCDP